MKKYGRRISNIKEVQHMSKKNDRPMILFIVAVALFLMAPITRGLIIDSAAKAGGGMREYAEELSRKSLAVSANTVILIASLAFFVAGIISAIRYRKSQRPLSGPDTVRESGSGQARIPERRSLTRKIVVAGALGAVSVVLFVTNIGMLPWFAGVSITVVHIPVIIGAVLEGPIVGSAVGLVFGVSALIKAGISPQGPIDVFFVNPLVSVLPRILVGIAAWAAYRAFRGKAEPAAQAAAGIAGSLANSFFVLGSLVLFGAIPLATAWTVLVANSLLEAGAAAVLTAGVVSAWKGIEGAGGRAKLADEEK
jgi:uncharacterized membrane protein